MVPPDSPPRDAQSQRGEDSGEQVGDGTDAMDIRERLYELFAQDIPFAEKAERGLALGVEHLDVENGHVTRISESTDYWETIASTDSEDGDFPPGLVLDLQETYCRRTIEGEESVTLHDAPAQGWADDIAYQTHGLNCYHGTPLRVDGDLYGTVCFVAEDPRKQPFESEETLFVELIAQMCERELERRQQETELERKSNVIDVLNRVLRHNLRNDMSVIQLGVEQFREDGDSTDEVLDRVSRRAESLMDLSETARQLNEVIDSEFERQHIDVSSLVDDVVGLVESRYPNADLTVDTAETATLYALPSLERAVTEVVDNAAKHAGPDPSVSISVEQTDTHVEIRVSDDGPGLPEQERDVLDQGGVETPLVHGSGLGLWLVHWIITAQEGSVETAVDETGTTITISLPKPAAEGVTTPETARERDLQQTYSRFRALFEQAFDAIILFDDDGYITEANTAAGELFGMESEEVAGRRFSEFVPESFDYESELASFTDGERDQGTVPLVRADGTRRTADYTGVTDVVPDEHFAILRDVTERKRRERKLREASQELETVVETLVETTG